MSRGNRSGAGGLHMSGIEDWERGDMGTRLGAVVLGQELRLDQGSSQSLQGGSGRPGWEGRKAGPEWEQGFGPREHGLGRWSSWTGPRARKLGQEHGMGPGVAGDKANNRGN